MRPLHDVGRAERRRREEENRRKLAWIIFLGFAALAAMIDLWPALFRLPTG